MLHFVSGNWSKRARNPRSPGLRPGFRSRSGQVDQLIRTLYREGGKKKSRAVFFGMSPRKGSSFSRFIRVNKGETRVPN